MQTRKVTITNKLGLHARAAAKLVGIANGTGAEVVLEKQDQRVNGKSIMGVMMLAASKGSEITISAIGKDEQEAISKLTDLVAERFGEDE